MIHLESHCNNIHLKCFDLIFVGPSTLTLTSSVSVEFSPERDVSSPADWVNADETCPDCRRQAPSYNSIPISICTENLATSQHNNTIMVITRNRKVRYQVARNNTGPKVSRKTPLPLHFNQSLRSLVPSPPSLLELLFSVSSQLGKLFPLISFSVTVSVS